MSKKSKRRESIKSSILILLLIAILLIASTYAWFTANTVVSVSTLDVQVQAQNGLQISVDGTNWKTVLTAEDITGAKETYTSSVNQLPGEMEPVSTVGTVKNGVMEMFYGTVSGDTGSYLLTATQETDAQGTKGKYIVFDAFFRVDKDSALSLTKDSKVTAKAGTTSRGLENAARVGFCVLGNTTSTDLSTIQGLTGGTTSYIWEPNYDVHTAEGVKNAKDTYGIETSETGGSQLEYYGVNQAISSGVALKSTETYFTKVTPKISTKASYSTDNALMNLTAGITKVRIYMWIEGQDVDCENSASGVDISYTLQFSIPTSTSTGD